MGRLRGRWHRYRGIPTIVTYHPSYLLRNPAAKKDAWEDLQMLMQADGPEAARTQEAVIARPESAAQDAERESTLLPDATSESVS